MRVPVNDQESSQLPVAAGLIKIDSTPSRLDLELAASRMSRTENDHRYDDSLRSQDDCAKRSSCRIQPTFVTTTTSKRTSSTPGSTASNSPSPPARTRPICQQPSESTALSMTTVTRIADFPRSPSPSPICRYGPQPASQAGRRVASVPPTMSSDVARRRRPGAHLELDPRPSRIKNKAYH